MAFSVFSLFAFDVQSGVWILWGGWGGSKNLINLHMQKNLAQKYHVSYSTLKVIWSSYAVLYSTWPHIHMSLFLLNEKKISFYYQ